MRNDKAATYMQVANELAKSFSKDRSSKVGCLFLDPEDYTVITRGYNGMPRLINEDKPERHERPLKYDFFEHAERNAIYNMARLTLKGSIAVTTVTPTIGCVRAILSVGAETVVLPAEVVESPHYDVIHALFEEGGVKVLYFVRGKLILRQEREEAVNSRFARKVEQHLGHALKREKILCKDPQGGSAVFLSQDFTTLAEGYSGLPRRANDADETRWTGDSRTKWVEPAIRNAIFNVVRPQLKGSVAVVTATTCVECARAISAVGAKVLVYQEPLPDFAARWADSISTALEMLQELEISVQALPAPVAEPTLF